jgi:hypothetical protein
MGRSLLLLGLLFIAGSLSVEGAGISFFSLSFFFSFFFFSFFSFLFLSSSPLFLGPQVPRSSFEDEAALVSDLAYAPVKFPELSPSAAIYKAYKLWFDAVKQAVVSRSVEDSMSSESAHRVRQTINFMRDFHVLKATRDCWVFAKGDRLIFGFRGTSFKVMGDLATDAQIVANKKRIKRVEEAKAFVKGVLYVEKFRGFHLTFVGHSLGGFVAEAVASMYSHTNRRGRIVCITLQTAAPLIPSGRKDGRPSAFGYFNSGESTFRVVRKGDPIPVGIKVKKKEKKKRKKSENSFLLEYGTGPFGAASGSDGRFADFQTESSQKSRVGFAFCAQQHAVEIGN